MQEMAKAFTAYTDKQRYDMYMDAFRFKEIEHANEQSSHSVSDMHQYVKDVKKKVDVIPELSWTRVHGPFLHIGVAMHGVGLLECVLVSLSLLQELRDAVPLCKTFEDLASVFGRVDWPSRPLHVYFLQKGWSFCPDCAVR